MTLQLLQSEFPYIYYRTDFTERIRRSNFYISSVSSLLQVSIYVYILFKDLQDFTLGFYWQWDESISILTVFV